MRVECGLQAVKRAGGNIPDDDAERAKHHGLGYRPRFRLVQLRINGQECSLLGRCAGLRIYGRSQAIG